MNDKFAWYLSRSSGWVAFVLLAITVVWGILGITKIIERRGLPRWMMDLHKYMALLTVLFTGVHIAGLVADNFVHIGWSEVLVPYAFDWKPGAVTFGIVAFYLLVAVQVSSWLRSRLPRRVWKSVHMLSYPALWLVAMHGLRAGTDSSNRLVRGGVMLVIGLTSFFTLLRVLQGRTARRLPRVAIVAPSVDPDDVDERALDAETCEPDAPVAPLAQVRAAQLTLHTALERMHATWPAPTVAEPHTTDETDEPRVERRHEARTLVHDVPPPP